MNQGLTEKQATNWISTALKLWLLASGNVAVPWQTRVNGWTLGSAPGLTFTIQGETNLTKGWVRVSDGTRAWSASIIKDTYTGKAALCGRSV